MISKSQGRTARARIMSGNPCHRASRLDRGVCQHRPAPAVQSVERPDKWHFFLEDMREATWRLITECFATLVQAESSVLRALHRRSDRDPCARRSGARRVR